MGTLANGCDPDKPQHFTLKQQFLIATIWANLPKTNNQFLKITGGLDANKTRKMQQH